jgi:light-regulated signal transduction histidine kinase (bacteriophytochrome)
MLLKERYSDKLDEKAGEYIKYTIDSVKRMDDLLTGLLAYAKILTQNKPSVVIPSRAALREAVDKLQKSIEETGAVITSDELPDVRADGPQFVQVLLNLIDNAIKFRSDKKPEIHVGFQKHDNGLRFFVRDNGIGIDPQFHERIFQMFQRLHPRDKYSGYGTGLTICRRIVERHGGQMWVESQPGQGATFYFTIPGN